LPHLARAFRRSAVFDSASVRCAGGQRAAFQFALRGESARRLCRLPDDDETRPAPSLPDDPDLLRQRPLPSAPMVIAAGVLATLLLAWDGAGGPGNVVGISGRFQRQPGRWSFGGRYSWPAGGPSRAWSPAIGYVSLGGASACWGPARRRWSVAWSA